MDYVINAESTGVLTNSTMVLQCYGNMEIHKITLKLKSTSQQSSVTVRARRDDGITSEDTKSFNNPIDGYFEFNISISATENQTIAIGTTRSNLDTIGGNTIESEKILQGLSARITSLSSYNCIITATSEKIWQIVDGGYPELVGTDVIDFNDWDRDSDGYPMNTTVWKINSELNDGLPFFFLMDGMQPITSRLYYNGVAVPLYYNGEKCKIMWNGT